MTSEKRKPLWLLPNLLSLDAPLVAVSWLYVFAKTWRVDYHPWETYAALGLAVWAIYIVDRLLDASIQDGKSGRCVERHEFHRKHRRWFKVAAICATVGALGLVVLTMPLAIYGYLGVAIALVIGFFAVSLMSSSEGPEIPYAKNILAGVTFAYGTALVAHVYLPSVGIGHLHVSREFICFAILCVLNISAIDLWEHANRTPDPDVKAADELALSLPLTLLGAASLVFALLDHEQTTRPFFYAILTGAALLQILNRMRNRFSIQALRVLADVALLAPVLVFLVLR